MAKGREKINLFLSFFKIGATTFGGGVGMLVNLQRELVDRRGWITYDEMLDHIAIAQCTPGIIMVNTATLIGAKRAGLAGSIVATVAVTLPSIAIITLFAALLPVISGLGAGLSKFMIGMRVAVCATSARSVFKLARTNIKDLKSLALALLFIVIGLAPFVLHPFARDNAILRFLSSNTSTLIVALGIISGLVFWKPSKVMAKFQTFRKTRVETAADSDDEPDGKPGYESDDRADAEMSAGTGSGTESRSDAKGDAQE